MNTLLEAPQVETVPQVGETHDDAPNHTDPAPPPPSPWQVLEISLLTVGGQGELTLRLRLPAKDAAPLLAASAKRDADLRARVVDLVRQSTEYTDFGAADAHLGDLAKEESRLRGVLEQAEGQLKQRLAPQSLLALSAKLSTTKAEMAVLAEAQSHAQNERDRCAIALYQRALAEAGALRGDELDAIRDTEATAAGLIEAAAESLGTLVTVRDFSSMVRNPFWTGVVARQATELMIAGTLPAAVPVPDFTTPQNYSDQPARWKANNQAAEIERQRELANPPPPTNAREHVGWTRVGRNAALQVTTADAAPASTPPPGESAAVREWRERMLRTSPATPTPATEATTPATTTPTDEAV